MSQRTIIVKNSYHDSVTLMLISNEVSGAEGVSDCLVAMATPMNKELLKNMGLMSAEAERALSNDLMIAVKADDEKACRAAEKKAELMLTSRSKTNGRQQGEKEYTSIRDAAGAFKEHSLAVISVAGPFVRREAFQALESGLNVMIFSDNVPLEDEIALKRFAHEKGLLVMGPDCGTAIIGGVGLCFANAVRRGNIGLIAASGTGLQEVSVLIDRFGGGVSQAIGVGGRDLSLEVGSLMMLDSLEMLKHDAQTDIIVLISKPPNPEVRGRIYEAIETINKPVVVCFIADGDKNDRALRAANLERAALMAVQLAQGEPGIALEGSSYPVDKLAVEAVRTRLKPEQKYIRALYCGGTLASEAECELSRVFSGVFSNISKHEDRRLKDPLISVGHSIIDLGDDRFTLGRPHPMIDPTVRLGRILREAQDPETAVLLLDFELGYGSHADPAGATLSAITGAMKTAREQGRTLGVVGYVLGTDSDYQNYSSQVELLRDNGVIVAQSNMHAVETAIEMIGRGMQQ